MPIDLLHWCIWMLLLTGPVLLAGRLLSPDRRRRMVGDVLGPVLIGLVWMHACLFDPPENWATLYDGAITSTTPDGVTTRSTGLGFLGFWFHPMGDTYWAQYASTYYTLAAFGLVPIAWAAWRAFRGAPGSRLAEIRLVLFAAAGTFLRAIPDRLIAIRNHNFTIWEDGGRLMAFMQNEVKVDVALGLGALAIAASLGGSTWRRDR